jgi:hypothetical protein
VFAVLRKSSRLTRVAGLLVEYVIIIIRAKFSLITSFITGLHRYFNIIRVAIIRIALIAFSIRYIAIRVTTLRF